MYNRTGHRWQYGEFSSHAGYLRLQIRAQNTQHLLIFHSNNCCTNVPQCYVTLYCLYYHKINVKLLSKFIIRKISLHPYVTLLNVFTLYVAVFAFLFAQSSNKSLFFNFVCIWLQLWAVSIVYSKIVKINRYGLM